LHIIPDEVPGLVIPDSVPVVLPARRILQVVDAEGIGFAFYQPVTN